MTTPRRAVTGLVLGSICLAFLACSNDGSPTDPRRQEIINFQTVLKGSLPGISPDSEGQEAIRDRAAWQTVWTKVHSEAPASLPEIDFDREMVVVILGPGCSGDTTISAIARDGGELVVHAATDSCLALTSCSIADFSLHMVRLPRFEGSVRFNVERMVGLC